VKVVPTRLYLRRAAKLFSERERLAMEDSIAVAPQRWPVIAGTGGLRKARVARAGTGKRGGARTIYFFWVEEDLLLLLLVYAKNEQEDIDVDDKRELTAFTRQFMEDYDG
jgi:hypothetical protein